MSHQAHADNVKAACWELGVFCLTVKENQWFLLTTGLLQGEQSRQVLEVCGSNPQSTDKARQGQTTHDRLQPEVLG